MNFKEAMIKSDELYAKMKECSAAMRKYDQFKSNMGLTPDHIKASPEWKQDKSNCDAMFAELRRFNAWFMKTFKKEYREYRRTKRA